MKRIRVSAIAAGAAVVGSTLAVLPPALAADANPYDPTFTPNATDLVGVGSDTTQIVTHDLAEAYNVGRSVRLASFAADGAPATVTLRSGSAAITRPNGSGAGKKLLFAPDNNPNVTFARSSSTLSPAEVSAGLKQAAFAVDGLQMAVDSTATNAPATLSIEQIVRIYKGEVTNWNQVGGKAGPIKALIPQSGSGTLSFFTSQLTAANGGIPFTPVAASTQEHSDVDVKGDPNAIAPFSSARAAITSTVEPLAGWKATRAVYNVVRTSDLASSSLGTTLEGVFGENGWICGEEGRAVIEANGFEQLASTEDGGACGEFVTAPVSNLKVTDVADAVATTTTLAAAATGNRTVTLKATVAGGSTVPTGRVEFYEGETRVGTAFTAGGVATLVLKAVTVGSHGYTAVFVPTRPADFISSESTSSQVTVKTPAAVTIASAPAPYGKAKTVTVRATVGGAAAAGSVAVKVGSGAQRTFRLGAGGSVAVPVPANTPAGTARIAVTLPGSASADTASATASLRIAKARGVVTAKLVKAKVKQSKRAVLRVRVLPTGVPVTGRVTVKAGSKVVARGVVRNGKVNLRIAKLKKGSHQLVVSYAGDRNVTKGARTVTLRVTK